MLRLQNRHRHRRCRVLCVAPARDPKRPSATKNKTSMEVIGPFWCLVGLKLLVKLDLSFSIGLFFELQ
jgi:hypothetical protein